MKMIALYGEGQTQETVAAADMEDLAFKE